MLQEAVNFAPNNYDSFTTTDDYVVQVYVPVEGSFVLSLYKNSAEPNRINKTNYITLVDNISGVLRDETSLVNPVITIEYDKVPDFNYVYIDAFKRYYFVVGVTSVNTGLWSLELNCDVLMSYKDAILNCEAFVDRNEHDYNLLITDNKIPLYHRYYKTEKIISTGNFFTGITQGDTNLGFYTITGNGFGIREGE